MLPYGKKKKLSPVILTSNYWFWVTFRLTGLEFVLYFAMICTHGVCWRLVWIQKLATNKPSQKRIWRTNLCYFILFFIVCCDVSLARYFSSRKASCCLLPTIVLPMVASSTHLLASKVALFTCMRWRRKWQPTPVFLPGESQGWGSLVGSRLWGCTESDTTEAT